MTDINQTSQDADTGERVPINVRPEVRDRLRLWLVRPTERRGRGYSDFISESLDREQASEAHPSQDAEGDLVLGAALAELAEAEEWADRLAYAIAPVSVIGEHSSANNPWMNAFELVGQRESAIRAPYEELVKALRMCGDAIVGIEWIGSQSSREHGSEVMISERSYDRLMKARDRLRTLAKENGPAFQALTRIEESPQ